MHLDVIDLRRFYYRTPLGRATQRSLQEAIRALWPDVSGETVAGFGFAAPLLRPFLGEAARARHLREGRLIRTTQTGSWWMGSQLVGITIWRLA